LRTGKEVPTKYPILCTDTEEALIIPSKTVRPLQRLELLYSIVVTFPCCFLPFSISLVVIRIVGSRIPSDAFMGRMTVFGDQTSWLLESFVKNPLVMERTHEIMPPLRFLSDVKSFEHFLRQPWLQVLEAGVANARLHAVTYRVSDHHPSLTRSVIKTCIPKCQLHLTDKLN